MKYQKLSLIILGILLSLSFVKAQKLWTLNECINYAHSNNLQVKRTQIQSELAEIDQLQAKTNILPDLNADINRNYTFGRSVDRYTNRFIVDNSLSDNYQFTSQVALFNGLQNYNNIQRTKFATLAAVSNIEQTKIEITFQISSAYLDILFKKELLEITKNQKDITSQQVDRTVKLVEAGSVAKGDLLEIQAQLASERLNVTNAQNALNVSILSLTQLLDLDSIAGFDIFVPDTVEPDFNSGIPPFPLVYNEALTYLPHIKVAEYELMSNEHFVSMRKGERSPLVYMSGSIFTGYSDQRTRAITGAPNVELEIGYLQSDPAQSVVTQSPQFEDYPYSNQFKDNIGQQLSIGVRIPILNRWEVNNNIAKAKIQLEDSQYNLDQIKQSLMKEIQQAYNDAVSAREKFNSATEAVDSYREAFTYTEQKYNVGIVNSVEYNIAKNNFIKAESDLLQAKYEYVFSVKILDFYRGIPITL